MKNIFLVCIIFLFACSKTNSTQTALIQFNLEGQVIKFSGNLDSTAVDNITGYFYGCYSTKAGGSYYTISGTDNFNSTNIVINTIATNDTLLQTSYRTGLVSIACIINNTSYGIHTQGDSINVIVSRYSNGIIDGTFSGLVSDTNHIQKSITKGFFQNLRVYY